MRRGGVTDGLLRYGDGPPRHGVQITRQQKCLARRHKITGVGLRVGQHELRQRAAWRKKRGFAKQFRGLRRLRA